MRRVLLVCGEFDSPSVTVEVLRGFVRDFSLKVKVVCAVTSPPMCSFFDNMIRSPQYMRVETLRNFRRYVLVVCTNGAIARGIASRAVGKIKLVNLNLPAFPLSNSWQDCEEYIIKVSCRMWDVCSLLREMN